MAKSSSDVNAWKWGLVGQALVVCRDGRRQGKVLTSRRKACVCVLICEDRKEWCGD